jgi:hypothetical protein
MRSSRSARRGAKGPRVGLEARWGTPARSPEGGPLFSMDLARLRMLPALRLTRSACPAPRARIHHPATGTTRKFRCRVAGGRWTVGGERSPAPRSQSVQAATRGTGRDHLAEANEINTAQGERSHRTTGAICTMFFKASPHPSGARPQQQGRATAKGPLAKWGEHGRRPG